VAAAVVCRHGFDELPCLLLTDSLEENKRRKRKEKKKSVFVFQ
jgi:hypothetical protein